MIKKQSKQCSSEVPKTLHEHWALEIPCVQAFYALPSLKALKQRAHNISKHSLCLLVSKFSKRCNRGSKAGLSHMHGFFDIKTCQEEHSKKK